MKSFRVGFAQVETNSFNSEQPCTAPLRIVRTPAAPLALAERADGPRLRSATFWDAKAREINGLDAACAVVLVYESVITHCS